MHTRSRPASRIEILEARIAPARYVWNAGSGNWVTPSNWFNETTGLTATDFPDGADDEAIFATTDSFQTVTLNVSVTVNKLGSQFGAVTQIVGTGAIHFVSATGTPSINAVSGSLSVGVDVAIDDPDGLAINSQGSVTLAGTIGGMGGALTKTGSNTLTFSGSAANTYTGATQVQAGTLVLGKNENVISLPGNVTVSDSATLETTQSRQFVNTAVVTLNGAATLKLNGTVQKVGMLAGTAGLLDFGGGGLEINANSTFAGTFVSDGGFSNNAGAILTLSGTDAAAHSIGMAAPLVVTGSYAATDFTVNGVTVGRPVFGTGTIGVLLADGVVSAGTGTDTVGRFSLASLGVSTFLGTNATGMNAVFDIDGTTAGTGYDQLVIRPGGTVSLAAGGKGSTLTLDFTATAAIDQSFTLIDNQGSQPVSGTFTGAPEGTVFTFGGLDYTLTYVGGDGNDVVLSAPKSAKANVSADGKTATFTDLDGDLVTIKSSKGGLTVDRIILTVANALGGASLLLLDATDGAFAGSNLSITAKPVPHAGVLGDGLVNVERIDAGANALGSVKIDGNLGSIDAGAVKALSVVSLGLPGLPGGKSELASLGALTVKAGVEQATLFFAGGLGSMKVGGSVVNSTFIFTTQAGAIGIGGDVVKTSFQIAGLANPTAKQAVALKSFAVKGSVFSTNILAGYDDNTDPVNADVQIGTVSVKGNWVASNLVAGTTAGADGKFGTADDALIGGGNAIVASIKSVTIGGLAIGNEGREFFGIVAEQIGALKIGKAKAKLSKTTPDALPLPVTGDFFAREIGATDPVLAALPNANASVGPAAINLADLTGGNGFKLSGVANGDFAGYSVSAAGDVNGDGFADMVIGAKFANEGGTKIGAAYVVFGGAGGLSAGLALSALDGSNGFKLVGGGNNHNAGYSVSAAGDVNGDGFGDVIVGAPYADGGAAKSGVAYVVFGKTGGFAASMALANLDGSDGFKISGIAVNDFAGKSVSEAGDVNGDGFGDLIIGVVGDDGGGINPGAAYVVFGKESFAATPTPGFAIALSELDGSNGFKLSGNGDNDFAGASVSGAGDVNGDGFGDVLVGGTGADESGANSGVTYVFFGKADSFASNVALANLDGSDGFKIPGGSNDDVAGGSVSAAGDVNGDGFADFIIGARGANEGGTDRGAAYVILGKASFTDTPAPGFAIMLADLNGANGFKLSGAGDSDRTGRSVRAAGDVNGDGFADVIIGAYGAQGNVLDSGAAYVVFGKAGGFGAGMALADLNGTDGFKLSGIADDDRAGFSVSSAGDVNGDGFADLIVGASKAAGSVLNSGAAYVVFGFGTGAATVSADGKTATWLDVDGDTVTLKSSKGGLTTDNLLLSTPNALGGSRLVSADFTDPIFAGSNISLTAKAATSTGALGDGLANVGSIFAGANALGTVKLDGDLGQLDAAAVKSLTVYSLGLFPAGPAGSAATSDLASLGALAVKTSVSDANLAVAGKLGKATIGGSMSDTTLSAQSAGPVKIGGDLRDARIFLAGVANPATAKLGLALASLSVKGSVNASQILAGYDATGTAVNADTAIGKVLVRGNWIASDLVAGASAGADGIFATADDALIGGGNAIVAKIASIVIGGSVLGTDGQDGDGFGFVAEEIGSLKIAKAKAPLTQGARNDLAPLPAGVTGDVRVREVA